MLFYCKRHDADAVGYKQVDSSHFVILSGSLFSKTIKTGFDKSLVKRRAQWLSDGLLVEHNERQYRLMQDVELTSCSTAAAMVCADSCNGWVRWKNADGQTLDQIYRKK